MLRLEAVITPEQDIPTEVPYAAGGGRRAAAQFWKPPKAHKSKTEQTRDCHRALFDTLQLAFYIHISPHSKPPLKNGAANTKYRS